MIINDDFLVKNERFSRLIKFYSYKLNDREVEWEFWFFLWSLLATKSYIPNDRYIAVCLRNFYLSKKKEKAKNYFLPLNVGTPCEEIDVDLIIDCRDSLKRLTSCEYNAVYGHYYEGKTFEEIAKETHRTRQAERQNCVRGVLRLRDFYNSKK